MQSEYCFDVSCKIAFEKGYRVIIPHSTHTTFDNDYLKAKDLTAYYEERIWANRYAEVLPVEGVLAMMDATDTFPFD